VTGIPSKRIPQCLLYDQYKVIPKLILTRLVGETITIGDSVKVTVLGVKGNQVRVGIDAPKDVAVDREEIYDRIKNEERSKTSPTDNGNW